MRATVTNLPAPPPGTTWVSGWVLFAFEDWSDDISRVPSPIRGILHPVTKDKFVVPGSLSALLVPATPTGTGVIAGPAMTITYHLEDSTGLPTGIFEDTIFAGPLLADVSNNWSFNTKLKPFKYADNPGTPPVGITIPDGDARYLKLGVTASRAAAGVTQLTISDTEMLAGQNNTRAVTPFDVDTRLQKVIPPTAPTISKTGGNGLTTDLALSSATVIARGMETITWELVYLWTSNTVGGQTQFNLSPLANMDFAGFSGTVLVNATNTPEKPMAVINKQLFLINTALGGGAVYKLVLFATYTTRTTTQDYYYRGNSLTDTKIVALQPLVTGILTAYGLTGGSSAINKINAITDWVARTCLHADSRIHPNGSTINTSVLPAGKAWADVNAVNTAPKVAADLAYWLGFNYDGFKMLDILLGTLDTGTGIRAADGLMTQVSGVQYRMVSESAFKYMFCTFQVSVLQCLFSAAGFESMMLSTQADDTCCVFIPGTGWIHTSPTFNERFHLGDNVPISPQVGFTEVKAGRIAGILPLKGVNGSTVGPSWDNTQYCPSTFSYFSSSGGLGFQYLRACTNNNIVGQFGQAAVDRKIWGVSGGTDPSPPSVIVPVQWVFRDPR